jgi:hypothetical protein
MRSLYFATALGLAATPAFAADLTKTSDGYTYFNKPGAAVAAHDADVRECRVQGARLYQPDTSAPVYAPGLAGAIGVAIGKAIVAAANNAKGRAVNLENCMVVKGWRVVALSQEDGEAADKLDAAGKAARFGPLIGAAEPQGTIVRVFENDALATTNNSMFVPARNTRKAVLSVDAMGDPPEKDEKAPKPAPPPKMPKSAKPPLPLKAEALGEIPAGTALVVVNIRGSSALSAAFERVGPDDKTPAWADGKPGAFTTSHPVKVSTLTGGPDGTVQVFAVPPGQWRLSSLSAGLFTVSLCLGSPSFEVAAGEVVYAGAFDAAATNNRVGPDLDLRPAKAVFPALSGLGDKVRPASYVNGSRGACAGAYMYALETPEQPFAPTYAFGSRAQPAPTVQATQPAVAADAAAAPAATPASAPAPAGAPTGEAAPASTTPAASTPTSTL